MSTKSNNFAAVILISILAARDVGGFQVTGEAPKAGQSNASETKDIDTRTYLDIPNSLAAQSKQVHGDSLIITWSEEKGELRGFSHSIGDWEILRVEPQKEFVPVVGQTVGAVRVGDSMAAYSSVLGCWDVLRLGKNSKAVQVVDKELVLVEDDGHLYTFSAAKGRWTSPTDPEFKVTTRQLPYKPGVSKVFDDLRDWQASLPAHRARAVSLHFDIDRLIVTSDRVSELEVLLAKLKELETGSKPPKTQSDEPKGQASPSEMAAKLARLQVEQSKAEETVKSALNVLEQQKLTGREEQRELRESVERSFDLRQELQRLEAERLRLKLQAIEDSLEARKKAREAIIEKRVKELSTQTK